MCGIYVTILTASDAQSGDFVSEIWSHLALWSSSRLCPSDNPTSSVFSFDTILGALSCTSSHIIIKIWQDWSGETPHGHGHSGHGRGSSTHGHDLSAVFPWRISYSRKLSRPKNMQIIVDWHGGDKKPRFCSRKQGFCTLQPYPRV